VLYNLMRRGIEFDLLPWCRIFDLPVMAYSPIEQGRLSKHRGLREIAVGHPGALEAQVALARVLRRDKICAIPLTRSPVRGREYRAALGLRLAEQDLGDLNFRFPLPTSKKPLEMI
jgi:diketogulonate reductase-like aldo/keto reductase